MSCWLAVCCIFGKRRNEICKLKWQDIWEQEGYLYMRFHVGKKRNRTALIDKMPYTKRITLKHYAVPFILEYLKEFYAKHNHTGITIEAFKAMYIFPSDRKESDIIIHTKFKNREGQVERKEYHYHLEGGYLSGADIYNRVKKINKSIWPHLGRHSVATMAAEDGCSEYDISNILDVSPRTASKYVKHGTAHTERWSERTG